MAKRRRTTWRLPLSKDELHHIAQRANERHDEHIASGHVFCDRQSGVWRRRDGSMTVLLVYRKDGLKLSFSMRGVRPGR